MVNPELIEDLVKKATQIDLENKKLLEKVAMLEKENKELKTKDEEGTQLIIKLDTKLYNSRKETDDLKNEFELYKSQQEKLIVELNNALDNANKSLVASKYETTKLKEHIQATQEKRQASPNQSQKSLDLNMNFGVGLGVNFDASLDNYIKYYNNE